VANAIDSVLYMYRFLNMINNGTLVKMSDCELNRKTTEHKRVSV